MITFDARTQIIISDDPKEAVGSSLDIEGAKKVALFLDEAVRDSEPARELVKFLKSKFEVSYYGVRAIEPTTDIVNEYASRVKACIPDVIVGVGGGSVIDLCKAVSVVAVNEGTVEDYHGTGKKFLRGIKKIMVPTTAGTGSEVTQGAVLINKATKFKRAIGGKYVAVDYAVLSAPLTVSMPDSVTASTGMDALGHAIESYTAKCANEITRMYSSNAFRIIYRSLQAVLKGDPDIALRRDMLIGSCLAGCAIYNSNTGAAHSMAYPLGIYNEVPHGLAVAKLLPEVVRLNIEKGCYEYAGLYRLIEGARTGGDARSDSESFQAALGSYPPLKYLNKTFSDYGIGKDNYEFLAERGLDLKSALSNNPVPFTLDDAKAVLLKLIK